MTGRAGCGRRQGAFQGVFGRRQQADAARGACTEFDHALAGQRLQVIFSGIDRPEAQRTGDFRPGGGKPVWSRCAWIWARTSRCRAVRGRMMAGESKKGQGRSACIFVQYRVNRKSWGDSHCSRQKSYTLILWHCNSGCERFLSHIRAAFRRDGTACLKGLLNALPPFRCLPGRFPADGPQAPVSGLRSRSHCCLTPPGGRSLSTGLPGNGTVLSSRGCRPVQGLALYRS